jgi:hypothetical protein
MTSLIALLQQKAAHWAPNIRRSSTATVCEDPKSRRNSEEATSRVSRATNVSVVDVSDTVQGPGKSNCRDIEHEVINHRETTHPAPPLTPASRRQSSTPPYRHFNYEPSPRILLSYNRSGYETGFPEERYGNLLDQLWVLRPYFDRAYAALGNEASTQLPPDRQGSAGLLGRSDADPTAAVSSSLYSDSATDKPVNKLETESNLANEEAQDSTVSPSSFFTASAGYSVKNPTPQGVGTDTEYGQLLRQKDLLSAKELEINWSGKGQHVEYQTEEELPLKVVRTLGYSATALIEAVYCKRILLARKSIKCNRHVKLAALIPEVEHLHRLQHPHVIQLVGSYLQGRTFCILQYPVADSDLSVFMSKITRRSQTSGSVKYAELYWLCQFYFCLIHALNYIHTHGIKHMDIKPSNILVKGGTFSRKVYL